MKPTVENYICYKTKVKSLRVDAHIAGVDFPGPNHIWNETQSEYSQGSMRMASTTKIALLRELVAIVNRVACQK